MDYRYYIDMFYPFPYKKVNNFKKMNFPKMDEEMVAKISAGMTEILVSYSRWMIAELIVSGQILPKKQYKKLSNDELINQIYYDFCLRVVKADNNNLSDYAHFGYIFFQNLTRDFKHLFKSFVREGENFRKSNKKVEE
jgi:uncharacterized membrane protein